MDNIQEMHGQIVNLAAHAIMYLNEGSKGNALSALHDIMEISSKARVLVLAAPTQEGATKSDSTGAMASAWFGTPGADKAVDAVFKAPYPLGEYSTDQWWFKELKGLWSSSDYKVTGDTRRAAKVACDLARLVLATPAPTQAAGGEAKSNAREYVAFLEREFGPSKGQNLPHFTIGNVSRAFGAGWIAAAPAAAVEPWRCFHCDAVFTDSTAAEEHFGKSEYQQPACRIDIAEYRKMEEVNRRHCEEDTDLHRQFHARDAGHQTALMREEEKGYARGLKDAAAAPEGLPEDDQWIAEAKKTLDRLSAFLQAFDVPHAVNWRDWIDNAEKHFTALRPATPDAKTAEERKPLTDEQIMEAVAFFAEDGGRWPSDWIAAARAIEAEHDIKAD